MPLILYKYLAKRYAKSMLEYGNIRLGTLYEYRTMENEQVRDEQEGKFRGHTQPGKKSFVSGDALPGAMGAFISPEDSKVPSNMSIETAAGAIFSTDVDLPNRNIYCMTGVASKAVMRSFGCNACIEIIDAERFTHALIAGLARLQLATPGGSKAKACSYEGRNADYYSNNGYWLKEPFYAPQKEFRIVANPFQINNQIKPEFLNFSEIIPFLKMHVF